MQALELTQPGILSLVQRPIPQPAAGQVLLRVDAAGVCMTDAHIFHGHFAIPTPRVLGHEIVGTVTALGADLDPALLGQRVGVQPARFCGACPACLAGMPELCANFQCLGNTHDGGYADYVVVDADQVAPLGDLPAELGTWLEPLACVLHALGRVVVKADQPVLIAGAGTFGKLFTQVLTRHYGLSVGIVDPNPSRIAQAQAMGAVAGWRVPRSRRPSPSTDAQIAAWLGGAGGLLIDTTGNGTAIERLLRWAGAGGSVLLFGVSAPETRIRLAPATLFARQLTLTASAGMTPAAFDAALTLLQGGGLALEALITARVGLADVPALLSRLPSGKVIITPHAFQHNHATSQER